MKSDLVDLEVEVHHRTKGAVKVSIDGDAERAVWLPLSAIEIAMRRGSDRYANLTLSERLALDKGLV